MPTINVTLSNSNQDGISSFNANRTNVWDVNEAMANISPFYGPNNADPKLSYFCFKIDGLPQGKTLTDVKLSVYIEQGPYNNGSSSRIYVAVENNLLVEPGVGSGAILRGTRGRVPWDRLGRIASAVSLLGNRCGPTHSDPAGLASVGVNIRDPRAILHKAFCDDQGSAAAAGRTLPASSIVTTVNFASALQPLVNDPGWNSTTQWVVVYLFSDLTTADSTLDGIGNISGIAYNNGMAGSTATTTGQGQIQNFHPSWPTRHSSLSITYSSADLTAKNTTSVSSGRASLGGKVKLLGRLYADRVTPAEHNAMMPGIGGAHDLPFTGMYVTANPFSSEWNLSNGNMGDHTHIVLNRYTRRYGRVDGSTITLNDSVNKTVSLWWDFRKYHPGITQLRTYSLRFYHAYDATTSPPSNGVYNTIIKFEKNGTTVFFLQLNPNAIDPFTFNWRHQIISSSGGANSAVGTAAINTKYSPYFYRYEVQVSEYATPKVTIRVYNEDSLTPLEVLTASPTDVEVDTIVIGDSTSGFIAYTSRLSDMEIWSDYYLNGQYSRTPGSTVGTPLVPQTWKWLEANGSGGADELEEVGTITSIAPGGGSVVLNTGNKLTYEDHTGLLSKGTNTYTKHANLSYGSGTRRALDLYVPDGTPPAGGWPIVMFSHGGFFISGDKNVVEGSIADIICGNGRYALASLNYVLAGLVFGSYPAYNTSAATGRYQSFILNYKEATHYVQSVAATYGLNPNKVIASGQSAGGYIALAAMASKNLTNDGSGRNLTLSGNTGAFLTPSVPDPSFIGSYVWSPPINLAALVAYDPTWHTTPNFPMFGSGAGRMETTSRAFMGTAVDSGTANTTNTSIDHMIRINAANLVPIAHCWGESDFLVPSNQYVPDAQNHDKLLQSAIADVAGSLPPGFTFTSVKTPDATHETGLKEDFDSRSYLRWMQQIIGS